MKKIIKSIVLSAFVLSLGLAVPATGSAENIPAGELNTELKSALQPYSNVKAEVMANGDVHLTGTVKTDTEMDDAVERAKDIKGVGSVKNDIRVVGETSGTAGKYIDDSAITASVKSKFMGEDGLDSMDITVETIDGVVTLTGEVENNSQVSLAERVAKTADGVKAVRNKLTVKK